MGKGPKVKNKKDKIVKEKVKASPVGTYLVERLVDGVWAEGETVKSNGRKALMETLKGQVKVRATA